MRELDALLQNFVDDSLPALSAEEIAGFEQILDLPDPTLHAYLVGRNVPDDPLIERLIARIRTSHRA
jgi:succinate dehydrogenase flavin-adding protein (antitoxin of CptAB toxin-antitoxin module)